MWLVQNFTQYKQAKIPSNVLSTTHVTDNFSCDHLKCKITKMGNLRPLFIYFSLFYKQSIVNNCSIKVAVTGFEPGSSGSGRERTVTVPQPLPLQCKFITRRNRCCTVQKRSLFHYTGQVGRINCPNISLDSFLKSFIYYFPQRTIENTTDTLFKFGMADLNANFGEYHPSDVMHHVGVRFR